MRKIGMVSAVALVICFAIGLIANAEMAKEGTFSGTLTYAGSHKIIPLDKERFVIVYENMGVRVSDSGEGPFHGLSTRNVGVMYFENGVERLKGYIFNTDKDGDKYIVELTEEASQLGLKPSSGTGKIIGGTGKFKGIQGDMQYTRQSMYPAADGTHQAISKFKTTYKIVETK